MVIPVPGSGCGCREFAFGGHPWAQSLSASRHIPFIVRNSYLLRRLSRNHAVEKQSPPIPALLSEWPQGIRALARVAARPHETVLNQWRLMVNRRSATENPRFPFSVG
jgi:hypothetical protein